MTKCVASHIEFDFSSALNIAEHDTMTPKCSGMSIADGNTVWPGVDYRIQLDSNTWLWLEVKNWRQTRPHTFSHKLDKEFSLEMRGKLMGTASYLAWRGLFAPIRVRYVLLFQPPSGADLTLLGPFNSLLRENIKIPIGLDITFKAIDLATWNDIYHEFPARQVR